MLKMKTIIIFLLIFSVSPAFSCGWHDYGNGTVLIDGTCTEEQINEISRYSTTRYLDKKYGGKEADKLPPIVFKNNGVLEYYEDRGRIKARMLNDSALPAKQFPYMEWPR